MSISFRPSSVGRALPLVLMLVLGSTQARAETFDPVIVEPAEQFRAFGNGAWYTWTTNTQTRPNRFKVVAQPTGGTGRVRLNAAGTAGWGGGLDPDENVAIYQQVDDAGRSDLYLYDLDDDARSKPPFVNTRRWEWNPRISNTWILFNRDVRRDGIWYTDMWAVKRSDGTAQRLGSWRFNRNTFVFTGTVGEQWASWTICKMMCRAYVRDLVAEETTKIPVHPDFGTYAPALDEANDRVYFTEAFGDAESCGNSAEIRKAYLSELTTTSSSLVLDLPDGITTGRESSIAPNPVSGMNDLLFERWRCAQQTGDIWQVSGVSTIPT